MFLRMDDLQNRFNSAAEHVALIADKRPKKDLLDRGFEFPEILFQIWDFKNKN